MKRYQSIILLCLVCTVLSITLPKASQKAIDRSWSLLAPAPPHALLTLTLALRQRNVEKLHHIVHAVSSPDSEAYGQYLSLEDVASLVGVEDEVMERVERWARSVGGTEVRRTLSRDFMVVDMAVSDVEKYFNVRMFRYSHKSSGRVIIRTTDPIELPSEIASDVELVVGLTDFFDYDKERSDLKKFNSKTRATNKKRQAKSSAPQFSIIYGSETDLIIFLDIYCEDGTPAKTITNVCQGHGNIIVAYVVSAVPDGSDGSIDTLGLINDKKCTVKTGDLQCELHVTVPAYKRLNVSAFALYNSSTTSEIGYYPIHMAPTPWITPEYIYSMYHIPQGFRASNPNNSQSVVGFEEQYISLSDLSSFFDYMGLPRQTPVIHGKNDQSMPGGEATLDIQYVMAIGAGVPTTFWSVSGPGPTHGGGAYILAWALEIANTTNPPLVTSISYGDTEQGFFEKFGNYDYINRMNNELAKMAARGLTVVAGSGDAGASNVGEEGNDISDTDPTCFPMRPFFPSNSPYVVSVSSTFPSINYLPICQKTWRNAPIVCSEVGEIAVDAGQGIFWTTGGGFSILTATPSWQAKEVEQFLSLSAGSLPPSDMWNSSGRGYPDVSTLGHNLIVVWGGSITPIGGTSASGPILAGIFSLLNEIRLNSNKPPIGLVTPFLYKIQSQNPIYFRDVVVGTNYNGDWQPVGSPYATFCPYGFKTQPGWDAVTGLGTPNFATLSQVINTR